MILKYLSKNKHDRKIFAVRQGTYKGNFLVYISSHEDQYNFLMLPYNEPITIEKSEFESGLDKKIVDYIKKIPNNVYEICCAQYNESKTKDNINRLKQSAPPGSVDSRKHKK